MRSTTNEFQIAIKAKRFCLNLYNLLENIPKKDFNIKEEINRASFELLKNIYRCNYASECFEKYMIEIKTNIALLNYLLEIIYKRKYINLKQLEKQIYLLTELTKMITVWLRNKEQC